MRSFHIQTRTRSPHSLLQLQLPFLSASASTRTSTSTRTRSISSIYKIALTVTLATILLAASSSSSRVSASQCHAFAFSNSYSNHYHHHRSTTRTRNNNNNHNHNNHKMMMRNAIYRRKNSSSLNLNLKNLQTILYTKANILQRPYQYQHQYHRHPFLSLASSQDVNAKQEQDQDNKTKVIQNADSSAGSTGSTDTSSATNEFLAQARISVESSKRQSRKAALQQDKQRNLELKRLLQHGTNDITDSTDSTDSSSGEPRKDISDTGFQIPSMYQIRISVDQTLRQELKMNGREKRGRLFLTTDSDGVSSLKGLKFEIHAFFRALKRSSYLLSASVPIVLEDGSIFSPGDESNGNHGNGNHGNHGNGNHDNGNHDNGNHGNDNQEYNPYQNFWEVGNDQQVLQTFQQANEFFNTHNQNYAPDSNAPQKLKRPSILIHIRKDPNAPLPPPPPAYLLNMPDPIDTETMTMLSFYSFPPNGIDDVEEFGMMLRKVWKVFGALGRVYVAHEGVNAQMALPTNVIDHFWECCLAIKELGVIWRMGLMWIRWC